MFTRISAGFLHAYLPIFILFLVLLLPLPALADGKWLSFGEYETPEGTPPIIKVLEDDSYHTTLEITIPGMWVEEVNEGGYTFQKLDIPDFATLGEIGKPAIPAMGEFVGFLEPSTNSVEYKDEDKLVLEDMWIYPFQTPRYDGDDYSDYGFDFDKKFYSQNIWFPKERANVSQTSIMREVCVAHTGIVPFEYNPGKRELIVHPQMLVTVYHKPGAEGYSDWTMPIGADPDFVEMYRSVIVNYENLGMGVVDTTTGPDYLIITPDDFSVEVQDLVDLLTNDIGYDVQVNSYDHFLPWYELDDIIHDFYLQNQNDYVLLFGNDDYIEPDYVMDPYYDTGWNEPIIPSDIAYVCFSPGPGEIPLPSLSIGRICNNDYVPNSAQVQVQKIYDHYHSWQPGLMLKCLQVASKKRDPRDTDFPNTKNQIVSYPYLLYTPSFTLKYGNVAHVDNEAIISQLYFGYQIVNYFGHGNPWSWYDWNLYQQDFTWDDITAINFGQEPPFRPVVFNVSCWTGRFMPHPFWGDTMFCQAEMWMNYPGGAEGVIAATKETIGQMNIEYDKWLFKSLYGYSENGHVYGGEGHLGLVMNWASIKMMASYVGTNLERAKHNFYSYLVFGDPSLFILPVQGQFIKGDNEKKIQRDNLETKAVIPAVRLYPNPVVDNLNISIADSISGEMKMRLYDLSGRLVMEQNYPIDSDGCEITISLDSLSLNSGLYTVKLEGPQFSKVSRIVYLPQSK